MAALNKSRRFASMIPIAARMARASPRSSVICVARHPFPIPTVRGCYSTQANDNLLFQALTDDIEAMKLNKPIESPEGFSFTLDDNPNKSQTVLKLSRACEDETIEVEVHMPVLLEEEDSSKMPLTVRVFRRGSTLEFKLSAYPNEVCIHSLSIKDSDLEDITDFLDLSEMTRNAFHKYLEARGINAIAINYLHELMIDKARENSLLLLKKLKGFVSAD